MPTLPEIISTTEAAALCGVSPETIRRWIRTKGLPAYNTELGLNIRIRAADLVEFARQHHIYLEPAAELPSDQA
jgi:excisionase family DNA binding protein